MTAPGIDLIDEAESRRRLGGISHAEFYRRIRAGTAPRAVRISATQVQWNAAEIESAR